MLSTEIFSRIDKHFKEVTLDDGIGYFQAMAIDNLVVEEENGRRKYQIEIEKDKKIEHNWKLLMKYIRENEIDFFPFSFMDTKGLLFILPCLLTLELIDELDRFLNHALDTGLWDDILNNSQKNTIIAVYRYSNEKNIAELKSFGMSNEAVFKHTRNSAVYKMLTALEKRQN